MGGFTIKASVTVDVEIFIDAETQEEARQLFDENLAMSAMLLDTKTPFDVYEDSITQVRDVSIKAEA